LTTTHSSHDVSERDKRGRRNSPFRNSTKIQNIAVCEDVLTYALAKLSGRKRKEVVDIYKMLEIKNVFFNVWV